MVLVLSESDTVVVKRAFIIETEGYQQYRPYMTRWNSLGIITIFGSAGT